MRPPGPVLGLGALLGAVGCGVVGGGRGPESVPEWTVREELRIGSVDDGATALTTFETLRVGPGGVIVTLHPREQEVRIHAADGAPLAVAGGRGAGPGELRGARAMGLRGDSIWVVDGRANRVSWFGLDGAFRSSVSYPVPLGGRARDLPPRPFGLLHDGSAHGRGPAFPVLIARGEIETVAEVRLDREGTVLDTLFVASVRNTQWEIADPDRPASDLNSYGAQPFADGTLHRLDPRAPRYLAVERTVDPGAESPTFLVSVIDFDADTLMRRRLRYEPMSIPPGEIERRIEARAEAIAALPFPQAPTFAEAARWGRETLYVPAHWPPVTGALWGRDGTIWLRGPTPFGEGERWSALSAEGEPLGRVVLPVGATLLAAERGTLWGSVLDALEVPYIVRWRVAEDG